MADFGLTPKGFRRKQYADIVSEMELRARELFGENINLSERSFLGLLIRLVAWFHAVGWMLAEKVYFSAYPDTAEGVSLDRLGPYAGIRRRQAQHATGIIEITGTPNHTVPAGFLVSTANEVFFETMEAVTLDQDGKGAAPIRAIETGPSGNVEAGAITEIVNPDPQIESVINLERTAGGRDKETDAEFRARFDISAEGRGSATLLSLRSALLAVGGVRAATVVENYTMETDDGGRPPKSIECYVLGGESQDIAQAILDTKAAGIETYGQESETVRDISGQEHVVKFTRAVEVPIHIRVTISRDNRYPTDGDARLKTTLIQYVGGEDADGTLWVGLNMGQGVVYSRLIALAYQVEGVTDVDIEVSTDGSTWTRQNIPININQVAQTSYAMIEVSNSV